MMISKKVISSCIILVLAAMILWLVSGYSFFNKKNLRLPINEETYFTISPNEKNLASIDMKGHFVLWQLEKQKKLYEYKFNPTIERNPVILWSPDGEYLAIGTKAINSIKPLDILDSRLYITRR